MTQFIKIIFKRHYWGREDQKYRETRSLLPLVVTGGSVVGGIISTWSH